MVQARGDWEQAQTHLDRDPLNDRVQSEERQATHKYHKLMQDEESFYKQKSRIQWLMLGDKNTAFFHKSVKHRQSRNQIHSLKDNDGRVVHDQKGLGDLEVEYYKGIMAPTTFHPHEMGTDRFPPPISTTIQQELAAYGGGDQESPLLDS